MRCIQTDYFIAERVMGWTRHTVYKDNKACFIWKTSSGHTVTSRWSPTSVYRHALDALRHTNSEISIWYDHGLWTVFNGKQQATDIGFLEAICKCILYTEQYRESYPCTKEKAISYIIRNMSSLDRMMMKTLARNMLIYYHHSIGREIRNSLGLWDNPDLLADCAATHPDDASMVIMEGVWDRLHNNDTVLCREE